MQGIKIVLNTFYNGNDELIESEQTTLEGKISTAGDGSCKSFSDSADTQLQSWGIKPGQHCASKDGARILLASELSCSNGYQI